MPMRTCLLLPHAFKYKENARLSSSASERRYFHGICRMFLRETARRARPVSRTREMHFVHLYIYTPTPTYTFLSLPRSVRRTLSSLFCLFFYARHPRTRRSSIHISFFIFAGEYHTDVSPNRRGNETTRRRLSRYPRAQTQRNPDASRANREEKPRPGRYP